MFHWYMFCVRQPISAHEYEEFYTSSGNKVANFMYILHIMSDNFGLPESLLLHLCNDIHHKLEDKCNHLASLRLTPHPKPLNEMANL